MKKNIILLLILCAMYSAVVAQGVEEYRTQNKIFTYLRENGNYVLYCRPINSNRTDTIIPPWLGFTDRIESILFTDSTVSLISESSAFTKYWRIFKYYTKKQKAFYYAQWKWGEETISPKRRKSAGWETIDLVNVKGLPEIYNSPPPPIRTKSVELTGPYTLRRVVYDTNTDTTKEEIWQSDPTKIWKAHCVETRIIETKKE
jgi:hypothetical protein